MHDIMQPGCALDRRSHLRQSVRRATAFLTFALGASLASACPWCGDDTGKMNEDKEMRALVPTDSATHTALNNGAWSNPATWGGSVPGNASRVLIPEGRTVTYDVNSTTPLRWLRVDGTLRFRTDITTALSIDTIVVLDTGTWEQGTTTAPIASNVTSTVTFTDIHPINDPMELGRGLLTKGKVRIHGAPVTPFVQTTGALANGATSTSLLQAPSGWKSGDTIVVSTMRPTDPFQTRDEVRTITAINGQSLTWNQGLGHARVVEFAEYGLTPYIANHTRNVVFRSATTGLVNGRFVRGHVMFMHNPDVDVRYAAFQDLGRTRKDINVTNKFNEPYSPGTNARGRYAVHFHRNGKDDLGVNPSFIKGCSVINASSWAYVTHDAFVNFDDNVAHNSFGAAFISENGGEIGRFVRNLATSTKGRGFIKDGANNHDLAISGIGFWFQGANLIVEENVAIGSQSAGFSLFQRTNVDLGAAKRIYRQNLLDFEAAGGNDYIEASESPLTRFWGNVSIANYTGIFNVDNEINGVWPTTSILDDHTDLNSLGNHAIRIEYYRNFTFRDTTVLRDSSWPANQWSGSWAFSANHLVDHLYPWQTRATDRWDTILVKGLINAVDNDDGEFPDRIAKQEVIGNSLVLQSSSSSGKEFANTSTMSGEPLVRYTPRNAVMDFPTFLPIAGRHAGPVTVTITRPANAPAHAKIFYVTGPTGFRSPSVESRLQSGQWTEYTGPITISSTSKLIAICVDQNVTPWRYSRIRNGVYRIDSTSPVTASVQFSPNGGSVSSDQPITLSTATAGASIRYTTDGSDPRTSTNAKIIPSGRMLGLSASATVRAFAYKGGNIDSPVASATFTVNGTVALPPAPTGLTATAGNGSVTLSWSASSGATSYTVKRSTTSGSGYTTIASGVTGTSFTNTGLSNGTTYHYVVSASNSAGESANSSQASAQPVAPITAPAAPTGLSATAGNASVTLSWSASSGATSYTVKRSTTSGSGYSVVANNLTATSYNDAGLTNGTTYHYVVSASNSAGESANSAQASAQPVAPGGGGSGGATVTILASDDRDTQSDNAAGTNTAISASLWNHAYFKFSLADVSSVSSARLRVRLPSGSSAVTFTAHLANSDSWTQSGSVPGYGASIGSATLPSSASGTWLEIDVTSAVRSEAAGDKVISIALVTNLGSWTGLNTKESDHAPRLVIDAVSAPAAPGNLSASAGNGSVTLSWSASTGATSYTVKRSTTSGSGYSVVASNLTSTSYADTGLTNGTTYHYVVSATNSGGESANSSQVSAKPEAPAAVTVFASDDRDTQSDNAAGTNTAISASMWNYAYFKFSLSGVSSVSSAKLRLHLPSGCSAATFTAHLANGDSWTQSGSVPGYGASIGSVTQPASGSGTWVEIDITNAVAAEVAGDKVISLAIRTNLSSWTGISTRESSNGARIVITQ